MAGWRPSTSSRPGGLILVEGVGPIAVATLAIADKDRQDLVDLLHRYGRRHPTGAVTIPEDCLSAIVPPAPPPTAISEKRSSQRSNQRGRGHRPVPGLVGSNRNHDQHDAPRLGRSPSSPINHSGMLGRVTWPRPCGGGRHLTNPAIWVRPTTRCLRD